MILVDRPRPTSFRRFRVTAHMMSDAADPAEGTRELVAFAARIGLRPEWIQNPGTAMEHFDLFDGAIQRALQSGAEQVEARELIRRVVQPRRRALG